MKKILNILTIFILAFVFAGLSNDVYAVAKCEEIVGVSHNIKSEYVEGSPNNEFYIELSNLGSNVSYELQQVGVNVSGAHISDKSNSDGNLKFISTPDFFDPPTNYFLHLVGEGINCQFDAHFKVIEDSYECKDLTMWQLNDQGEKCTYQNNGCLIPEKEFYIQTTMIKKSDGKTAPAGVRIFHNISGTTWPRSGFTDASGIIKTTQPGLKALTYDLDVEKSVATNYCRYDNALKISLDCKCDVIGEDDPEELPDSQPEKPYSLCKQIPAGPQFDQQREDCYSCTGGDEEKEENKGVWTAIGCIKRDPQSIMQRLISVGLGMSGGVALLTFLAAGFIFSTSQGDPKAYGKAKEMMTASIVGILFVIFSVTLLQFIGYEILKIPGFGG